MPARVTSKARAGLGRPAAFCRITAATTTALASPGSLAAMQHKARSRPPPITAPKAHGQAAPRAAAPPPCAAAHRRAAGCRTVLPPWRPPTAWRTTAGPGAIPPTGPAVGVAPMSLHFAPRTSHLALHTSHFTPRTWPQASHPAPGSAPSTSIVPSPIAPPAAGPVLVLLSCALFCGPPHLRPLAAPALLVAACARRLPPVFSCAPCPSPPPCPICARRAC